MHASPIFRVVALLAAAACSGQTVSVGNSGRVTGNGDELERVLAAVSRADDVYTDPRFWAMVAKRRWLATPGDAATLDGDAVRDALSHIRPSNQHYSIEHVGWSWLPFYLGAQASALACTLDAARPGQCGKVLINVGNMNDDLYLVNTIAHETTHVVGTETGTCGCDDGAIGSRFRDDTEDDAAKVWLVSYALGDLAECFYLMCGDEPAVDQCMKHMVNGRVCDRRRLECQAPSPIDPTTLTALRSSRGYCTGPPEPKKYECPGERWTAPPGGPSCPSPPM